ncbi:MAG TPA: TonB-dependent receptor [Gemmatimonadaceae bacterium]
MCSATKPILAALPLALAISVPGAISAQDRAELTGIVRNAANGDPIANATLTAVNGRRRTTDGAGRYRFTIEAGALRIRATAFGFNADSQAIVITAGSSNVMDFALKPSAVLLDQVVTIGTRAAERTAAASPAPIDMLSGKQLEQTGAIETWQQLQRLIPSVNVPHNLVSDIGSRPITLRGLAPHHILVLVNGKRRHPAAVLLGQQPTGVASTAFTDLSAIPSSAIDRIEVLRDGASAQYGSDAIGGVVNVILKSGERRDLRASIGQALSSEGGRSHRDGRSIAANATIGKQSRSGANVTFSGEVRHREPTNRAYPDVRQQYFTGDSRNNDSPRISSFIGDGEINDFNFFLNAGRPVGRSSELYASAGAARRDNVTPDAFFRRPLSERTVRPLYPDGFLPKIETSNRDLSGFAGMRSTSGDWLWDISTGWGMNRVDYNLGSTVNPSMGAESPTSFFIGRVRAGQWTTNVDLSRDMEIGPLPLTLAGGAEFRVETYRIGSGDEASWRDGGVSILDGPQAGRLAPVGAEGMIGFRPADHVSKSRSSLALYLESDGRPFQRLLLQLAGRVEQYSDFGSKVDGKISTRFEFVRGAAARASVSTGFRAPSLSQQYLSTTRTIPGPPVNGVQLGRLLHTFPVNSDVARLMGATPLRPETSITRTAGLVLNVPDVPFLSADFYAIDINDRIGSAGQVVDESFLRLFEEHGFRGVSAGTYFRNNVDMRTRGADVVISYAILARHSSVTRLFGAYNHNRNRVTRIAPPPPELENFPSSQFGRSQQGAIEHGQPRQTIILGVDHTHRNLGLNVGSQLSGPTAQLDMTNPDADQYVAAKWITSVRASYRLRRRTEVSLSIANLFDVYPSESNGFKEAVATRSESLDGISRYPAALSTFGLNGRTIYIQLSHQ